MREIKIGKIYKHFKGKLYIVLDIVNDSESNNDVEQKYRFEEVEEINAN